MDGLAEFMVGSGKLPRKINWSTDFDPQLLKSLDPKLVKN
jgi:hypothetical protein